MKTLSLVLLLSFLTACSAMVSVPLPHVDNVHPNMGPPPFHHGTPKAPAAATTQAPAHDWTITEDRFISTHAPDVSAEALGISREQIDARKNDLDQR
jgi:hypothetical protein